MGRLTIWLYLIVPGVAILFLMYLLQAAAKRKRDRRWDRIPWSDERLREFIRFYQSLGFYDANKPEDELFAEFKPTAYDLRMDVEEQHERGETFRSEITLLANTTDRIWWGDLESGVSPAELVYQDFLQGLVEIARGQFNPTNIKEAWDDDEGPVCVTFELDGRPRDIQIEYDGDWINLEVLSQINALLPNSEYCFEVVEQEDQTAQILMLTKIEKDALRKHGWRFQT